MTTEPKWLYFNIHDLVKIRVEAGHISERSVRLAFEPSKVQYLDDVEKAVQRIVT